MGYKKKQYYEDDFIMNHFERMPEDFVFLDKVWPSVAATATISVPPGEAWQYMTNGSNITLKNAAGESIVVTLSNATATSSDGVIGGDLVNTPAMMVQRIAQAINATTDTMTASPIDGSADSITITQTIAGSAGNQPITTTNEDTSLTIDSAFINGKDRPVPFSYATKGVRLRLNPDAYKTNLG